MDTDDFGNPADPYAPASMSSRSQQQQQENSYQQPSRAGIPPSRSASVAVYSSSPPAPGASLSLSPAPAPQSQSISSAATRKRASHTIAPTTSNTTGARPPLTDVYSLPAAVAYAAAHPRRQIPKFGPYLLLQTLGEGEFGKVKLGLHQEYGEEVAVKLIRRGSVDNAVRFSKIEREIEVLKNVRHPNIVRLYDVIETDKYIGIILEYASGGELFDHILAHRYLRERDASKLFAQLISGVSYIHSKKIVHRDLKLENLLLDRNRNVIITDFGFANKFEHKADDLMQTSCGSPCYAAPELVISEGLYVGSAVDIWSCGVILYAMLAGYLPFDDDPANPDGDNINLLYKYIINTQLTFPEYVSVEARDLLNKMLVPDPAKRCDLEGVKRHPWLKAYASVFEKSVEELEMQAMEMQSAKRLQYQKMMRQREKEAAQQQQQKMSRTQSARLDGLGGGGGLPIAPSSGSTRARGGPQQQQEFLYETGGSDLVLPTTGRRAVASAIIPTSRGTTMDEDPFSAHSPPPPPAIDRSPLAPAPSNVSSSTTSRQQHGKSPYDDTGRPRKTSAASKSGTTTSQLPVTSTSPSAAKKKGGYRHTIQLEYDDGEQQSSPMPPPVQLQHGQPQAQLYPPPQMNGFGDGQVSSIPLTMFMAMATTPTGPPFQASANGAVTNDPFRASPKPMNGVLGEPITSMTTNGYTPDGAAQAVDVAYAPMLNMDQPETDDSKEDQMAVDGIGQETPRKQSASQPPSRENSNVTPKGRKTPSSIVTGQPPSPTATPKGSMRSHMSPVLPPSPTMKRSPATEPMVPTKASLALKDESRLTTPASPHPPSISTQSPKPSVHTQDDKAVGVPLTPSASSAVSVTHSVSTSSNKSGSRHRKGLSLDKFNLGKLIGSGGAEAQAEKVVDRSKPPTTGSKANLGPPSTFDTRSPSGTASETGSMKSKASRRKTLTLMMAEPFGTAKAAVRDRGKTHRSVTGPLSNSPAPPQTASSMQNSPTVTKELNGDVQEQVAATAPLPARTKSTLPPTPALDTSVDMMNGGSTGKAKKVMDWFRKRSLAKNASAGPGDALFAPVTPSPVPQRPPTQPVQQDEPLTPTADTYRQANGGSSSSLSNAPQVVVTAAPGVHHPNWDVTPRSASGVSHHSTDTAASISSPPLPSVPSTATPGTRTPASDAQRSASTAAASAKPFEKTMLRVHHGAVDQGTITTGFPPETMKHVIAVLLSMGIELQRESEFKYRCIRHKRKKERMAMAGLGIKDTGVGGVVPVHVTGAAASNGVDRRGLPIPSASAAFGATGGMLRGLLLRRGSHAPPPTPSHSLGHYLEGSEDHALSPVEGPDREPVFGDRTVDQQDEVRFSVELTRLDRLDDTYSLDIRRLKGNLRSYKFLYDLIRERATLAN